MFPQTLTIIVRKSKILSKWREGRVARLCVLSNYLPHYPRLAVAAGFDGIWVDGEHKPFDPRQVQALAGFHHLAGIDCIWRPPTKEKNALYRLLEDGATGLLIPHVNSAAEARTLVQAVKFPPLGDRGVDGVGLDGDFGLAADWPDYLLEANRETVLLVQVETPLALERVEEIAAVQGVDGIFLGAGDMAVRLGCTPSAADPAMVQVRVKVRKAVERCAKVWGQPAGNIEDVRQVLKDGARFLVYGSDYRMVQAGLRQCGSELENLLGDAG